MKYVMFYAGCLAVILMAHSGSSSQSVPCGLWGAFVLVKFTFELNLAGIALSIA